MPKRTNNQAKQNNKLSLKQPDRKRRRTGPPRRTANLSPCASSYLRALCDPFSDFSTLPCIPDSITIPSYKFRCVSRGSAFVGINGIGAVAFDPWTMAWRDAALDSPLLLSTAANDWLSTTSIPGTTSPFWTLNQSNSLFTYANLSASGIAIRLVAAGIRISYTGTQLNMGGQMNIVRLPSNNSVVGTSPASLTNLTTTTVVPVTRSTHFVNYYPDQPWQLGYLTPSTFAHSHEEGDLYPLCFTFNGITGSSFYVEAVSYFEVVGSTFPPTPSHMDTVGYSAIMTGAQTVAPPATTPQSWLATASQRVADAMITGISHVATGVGSAAASTAVHMAINGGRSAYRSVTM